MKLLSKNGVLPGSGGFGAQFTYNPSSQTCTGGCALDGSGCGTLGNEPQAPSRCVKRCEDNSLFRKKVGAKRRKCRWFSKGKSAKRCKKKNVIENCPVSCNVCGKNGEEVCEGKALNEAQCNSISCCGWNDGQCWSSVGQNLCYASSSAKNIFE